MDVAALRAEIKTWERDFRAQQGRDPSIQEIKDQPAIAAKYKLYKSLSKAAASGPLSRPSAPSATPPPPEPRHSPSSSIIPKSRAVKVDPPALTSNPFSPVKNRNKFSHPAPSSQRASDQSRTNPFATPSKPKNRPRHSPSPDPFPLIQPLILVQPPPLSPAADSAVTRARKRLRGEPVSPSPVKEKRPRVTAPAALSFTGRAARNLTPDLSDGDDFPADPNDTIIADTPMKPRTGGRNFKVLFDDALSNGEKRAAKALPSRKKANSPAPALLGTKRHRPRALTPSSDEDDDWSNKPRLKSLEASAVKPAKTSLARARTANSRPRIPKALVPTKDDLWSAVGPANASQPKPSSSPQPSARAPNKRALPDEPDYSNDLRATTATGFQNLPLIPPSPPPPDASKPSGTRYADKGKAKAKAAPFARKKAKLLEDAAEVAEQYVDDDEIQVKEIDPSSYLPHVERDSDADFDWDHRRRKRPDTDDHATSSARPESPGKFEVNLPDDMQRMLAISPGGGTREDGEKVVRELLYGSREMHYNPRKGGEIWDVGEEFEHSGHTEEDWEGEPVPWEVGEL